MMTLGHIRSCGKTAVFSLCLCLSSLFALGQLKADFTMSLDGACPNQTATFVNASTGFAASSATTFTWNLGNGTIVQTHSVDSVLKMLYPSGASYSVTLTVTSDGQTASKNLVLSLTSVRANFTIHPSLSTGSLPQTDTFINASLLAGRAIAECFWDFGDGNTLTTLGQSPSEVVTHTYTTPGTMAVQMTLITASGCSSYVKENNVVSGPCAACTVGGTGGQPGNSGVQASFTTSTKFVIEGTCLPEVFYFNSTSQHAARLLWDFGDGATAVDNASPSHSYMVPGIHQVTLRAIGSDSSVSTSVTPINVYSPSASVSVNTTQACLPGTVTLRTSNIINTVKSAWYPGDGSVINNPDSVVTYQYKAPGSYTPKLILWDSFYCAGTFSPPVPLEIDSLRVTALSNINHVCDSAMVRFTESIYSFSATEMGQSLAYHWDFGTGNTADTASTLTPAFTYRIPGTYVARLTVASKPGCLSTGTDTIRVTTSARGSITAPASTCTGAPVNMEAIGDGAANPQGKTVPGLVWNWLLPQGRSDTGQRITFVPLIQGEYTVDLVAALNGCFDTTSTQLRVLSSPIVALSPQQPQLCQGDSVRLTAHDGNTYQWTPGPDSGAVPSIVAAPRYTTLYKVRVTNANNCTTLDSTLVLVANPFSIALPKDTFVCTGSGIVLSPEALGGQGPFTYRWISGVAPEDSARATLAVSPGSDTTYTVVGYDAVHCFTDTAVTRVTVEPLPSVKADPVGVVPAGNSVTLTVNGSPDVDIWEWSPPDYLSCTDCASPVSTPQSNMVYTVTGKTQYGCAASDTVRIQLICLEDRVSVPKVFTPNGDGINDVFYPRGKGIRSISSFRIFGRWGNTVFEKRNIPLDDAGYGWDGRINGAEQPVGTYVYELTVVCDTGDVYSLKGTVTLER